MAKHQVPVLGGLRKVINTGAGGGSGTTIAEYGSTTVTLAQIKQDLGVTSGTTVVVAPTATAISIIVDAKDGADFSLANAVPNISASGAMTESTDISVAVVSAGNGSPLEALTATWAGAVATGLLETETSVLPVLTASGQPLVFVYCPHAGVIQRVRVLTAGGSGSCVVDIWKAPFGSFPPVVGNSIVASAPPTISSGVTYSDATLTGWTKAIVAGDVLAFSLTSTSVFTAIQVVLEVQPS